VWRVVVRDELQPLGFEIVSVAIDTNGVAALVGERWIMINYRSHGGRGN
jgi:hypothetical protein